MRKHPRKFIANVSFIIHREQSEVAGEARIFQHPTPRLAFPIYQKQFLALIGTLVSSLFACSFGDGW